MFVTPSHTSVLVASTALCSALLIVPSTAEASCFTPNQTERNISQQACAIDGYVTGQIATPGAKIIDRFLSDRTSAGLREGPSLDQQPFSYVLPDEQISDANFLAFAPQEKQHYSVAQASNGTPATVDPARLGRTGPPNLAFYATGLISDESQDQTSREASSDTTRIIGGMGLQFIQPDWLLGVGVDISSADIDYGRFEAEQNNVSFRAPRTEQNTDEYGLQVFGLKFFSDFFAQGALRAAYSDNNIHRYNLAILNDNTADTIKHQEIQTDIAFLVLLGRGTYFLLHRE